MVDADLLKILRCPETLQELRVAETSLIEELNRQVASASLKNRAGRPVTGKLDGGLLRADGKFLYPVQQDIPLMLKDEAIPMA
jgi:uncharacterized protein